MHISAHKYQGGRVKNLHTMESCFLPINLRPAACVTQTAVESNYLCHASIIPGESCGCHIKLWAFLAIGDVFVAMEIDVHRKISTVCKPWIHVDSSWSSTRLGYIILAKGVSQVSEPWNCSGLESCPEVFHSSGDLLLCFLWDGDLPTKHCHVWGLFPESLWGLGICPWNIVMSRHLPLKHCDVWRCAPEMIWGLGSYYWNIVRSGM